MSEFESYHEEPFVEKPTILKEENISNIPDGVYKYVHIMETDESGELHHNIIVGPEELNHWELIGNNQKEIESKPVENAGFIFVMGGIIELLGTSGGLKGKDGKPLFEKGNTPSGIATKRVWDNETSDVINKMGGNSKVGDN